MAYANLSRLVDLRERGVEPRGRRSAIGGPQERSRPTGWVFKSGNVTIQELEFSNGYVVGALQPEGQKAVIKGPEATARLLEAINNGDVQRCYDAWLSHVSKGLGNVARSEAVQQEQRGGPHSIGAVHREAEAVQEAVPQAEERAETEGRLERLEGTVEDIKSAMSDILAFMQQNQPKAT